jgi:hypothetical protein
MYKLTRDQLGEVSLALTALLVLFVSFQLNFFGAAPNDFFEFHQRDSESLVLGRVVETRQNGYFSNEGFLGVYADQNKVDYQYKAYSLNLKPESNFNVYTSSAGLQGFFYSFLDGILTLCGVDSGSAKLIISKSTTSFMLAAMLALFILLIKKNFGYLPASLTFSLAAISQWVVVFSNNLYWMFFLIFLPFVAVFYFLSNESKIKDNFKRCCIFIFLAIFIKSLAGYEYISTILISTVVPLVFFSIRNDWGARIFIKRLFILGTAGLLGFIAAVSIHAIQLGYRFGGLKSGFSAILSNVSARTHGDSSAKNGLIKESLESNAFDVLSIYWHGKAFDLNALLGVNLIIEFSQIIIFLLLISVLGWLLVNLRSELRNYKKDNFAAIVALWFSILAPISWYVLAKGHSYIHYHMNHVLWYVPFLLFGFVYTGFFARLFVKLLFQINIKGKIVFISAGLFFFLAAFILINYPQNEKNKTLAKSFGFLSALNKGDVQLFYFGKNLIYISKECNSSLDVNFFLHTYPSDNRRMDAARKPHGFDNLDFGWQSKQLFSYTEGVIPFWNKICVASIELKNYPIKSLATGQFNEKGQLWESRLEFSNSRFVDEFLMQNVSDHNWSNGVSKVHPGFFVENTFANRQSLRIGDYLEFASSGARVIESLEYSDNYINIFVSGDLLEPETDGFPNKVVLRLEK